MTDWTLTARGEGQYEVVAPSTIAAPTIILHVGATINPTELQQIVQGIQFGYENRPNLRANMQIAAQRGLTIGLYVSEAPSSDGFGFFSGELGATDWPLILFGGSRPVGWTLGQDARIGVDFGKVRYEASYLSAAGAPQPNLFEQLFSRVFGHEIGHAVFGRHNFSERGSIDDAIAEVSADLIYRQQVVDDWYAGVPIVDKQDIDSQSQVLSRAAGTSLDDYMREALRSHGTGVYQGRGRGLIASDIGPQTIYATGVDASGAPLLIPLYTLVEQPGGVEVLAWGGAAAGERWIFSGDPAEIHAMLRSEGTEARQRAAIIVASGVASAQRIEQAGDIGRALASALGRLLPIEDPMSRWAVSAVIGTVVENLAEALEAGGISEPIGAGLGAAVKQWNTGVGSAMLNAAGAFIGTWLASELIEFDTIGGQIGAAIGSAVGAAVLGAKFGAKFGSAWGPLGAAIGAFIGYIVGGLIGSIFGGELMRPTEISFGRAATENYFNIGPLAIGPLPFGGTENYGVNYLNGQLQVHQSFDANWNGQGQNLASEPRWEVHASTSTWVMVPASFIEVLIHEITHGSLIPGTYVRDTGRFTNGGKSAPHARRGSHG